MSLKDAVESAPVMQASRVRESHPQGWEPGVKFDPDQIPSEVTTPPMAKLESKSDWAEVLKTMQINLPDGYELRLVEAKYDPAAWHRDGQFVQHPSLDRQVKEQAVTRPAWRYRFKVVRVDVQSKTDVLGILNSLKRASKPKTKCSGEAAFVLNFNDWQVGKDTGGGTAATVERLDRYFDLAVERIKDLGKRRLGELVIFGGGDLVEGCEIYPNQPYQVDLDIRAQGNHVTTLVVAGIDRLAPLFERVRIVAVGGNHGERRIDGRRVNRRDNYDLKAFEDAARELSRDPRSGHVTFMIAQAEPSLTVDIQGHVTTVTHGHVYGKGKGVEPSLKAYEWYKNQAAAHAPAGDSVLLVGNHFHHDIVKNWGTLLFVQTPAADGGSPEFSDYTGTDCPSGMASWVMDAGHRFRDYEVLR